MSGEKSSLRIEDRDVAILRGLFESRTMTAAHIASLYFNGKGEATKKRLQKLKAAGLIGERRRRAYEPAILFLTPLAFKTLKEQGVFSEYPKLDPGSLERRSKVSDFVLRHELEVMDVKSVFHDAMRSHPGCSLVEFSTWPLLYQFETVRPNSGTEILIKPDGFIRIHEEEPEGGASEHTFFLEVDRSTETQETLVSRAGYYLAHYKTGGFATWNGADRSAYKDFPFRVLMVFKTAERRNNNAERLLQHTPPILNRQFCLSTLSEVKADPFGEIWMSPRDYREATKGTPFDPDQYRPTPEYRRRPEREAIIEKRVKRSRLLT